MTKVDCDERCKDIKEKKRKEKVEKEELEKAAEEKKQLVRLIMNIIVMYTKAPSLIPNT